MNKTTSEEAKALALKYDALAGKLGSVTLSFMQLAALISEACERGEPIGFIAAETLSDLKNPDWQSKRNTPANLWTINNPPSRAVIPVYLGAAVWSTDGKTSWVDAPQWGNARATPPQPVAAEVPPGMVLLPIEPTPEMIEAVRLKYPFLFDAKRFAEDWRLVVNAAAMAGTGSDESKKGEA